MAEPVRVLLVEDNPGDALLVREALSEAEGGRFELTHVSTLAAGLDRLSRGGIDVILLDLSLPDAQGMEAVKRVRDAAPGVAMVVLTGLTDGQVAMAALQNGAEDYLTKQSVDSRVLERVIRYSIERNRFRGELNGLNQALKQAMEEKNQFLGMAAHDIRSPLHAIRLLVGNLVDGLDGPVSEGQIDSLKRIRRQCDGMLNLLHDLLDVSALETGKLEVRPVPQDPLKVLKDVFESFTPIAGEKGIALAWEAAERLPPALIDYDRILQVLSNLLSNAVKFCRAGDTIRLGARAVEDALAVWVQDSGPGIKEADLPYLFQPFQKLSARPTAGEKGTGLGLSICRKIALLHQGMLKADSEEGKGATFTLTLPLAPRPLALLWVDDEDALTDAVRRILEGGARGPVDVLVARDAPEALAILARRPVDLVVSDIGLPGMNGLDLLERIKREHPGIPVVMATGRSDLFSAKESLRRGADDYIVKPFQSAELRHVLEKVLVREGKGKP